MSTANQRRDLALIQRIRQGDDEAKEILVAKYLPMIKHIVKKYYASFLEFDDLIQEGYIGLLAAIDEYKPEDFEVKFSSFAYMCIIRKVYNVIKQTTGNKHKALNDALSLNAYINSDESRTLLDLIPEDERLQDPLEMLEAKHINQRIDQLLRNHLSILEYTVAALIVRGYTSGEIEQVIGVKAKVVDNARTRVKGKLRRIVERYGSLIDPDIPTQVRRRQDLYLKVQLGG